MKLLEDVDDKYSHGSPNRTKQGLRIREWLENQVILFGTVMLSGKCKSRWIKESQHCLFFFPLSFLLKFRDSWQRNSVLSFFFFFLEGTLGDSCHAWSFLEVFFSQSYHKCISPAINTDRSIRPNPMHGHQDHKSILVRDIMRRNKSRGCCRSLWSHCIKIHENMTFTLSALVVIFSMDQNNGRFFSMALWHCRFILAELNRLIPNWYQVPKDWNFIKKDNVEKPRRYWRPWPCTTDKFISSVLILDKIIETLKTYLHLWVRILLSFWKMIIVVALGNKIWVTMCWSLNGGVYKTTILIYFQAVRLEYFWCFTEHFAMSLAYCFLTDPSQF